MMGRGFWYKKYSSSETLGKVHTCKRAKQLLIKLNCHLRFAHTASAMASAIVGNKEKDNHCFEAMYDGMCLVQHSNLTFSAAATKG
jgi:hypothetical protein